MKTALRVSAITSIAIAAMFGIVGCASKTTTSSRTVTPNTPMTSQGTSSFSQWAGKYVATDNPKYYVELKNDGHYIWQTANPKPEQGTYDVSSDMGLLQTHPVNSQHNSPNPKTMLTPFDGNTIYEAISGGQIRRYVKQ